MAAAIAELEDRSNPVLGGGFSPVHYSVEELSECVEDYTILRRIGHGAMGATVYQA